MPCQHHFISYFFWTYNKRYMIKQLRLLLTHLIHITHIYISAKGSIGKISISWEDKNPMTLIMSWLSLQHWAVWTFYIRLLLFFKLQLDPTLARWIIYCNRNDLLHFIKEEEELWLVIVHSHKPLNLSSELCTSAAWDTVVKDGFGFNSTQFIITGLVEAEKAKSQSKPPGWRPLIEGQGKVWVL